MDSDADIRTKKSRYLDSVVTDPKFYYSGSYFRNGSGSRIISLKFNM